jgi:hypothetical protein
MASSIHTPLKITELNEYGIWRQRYEHNKRLQNFHIDEALLSETHLKPHERFCIPNYHFYCTYRFPGRKCGTAVAGIKSIPHNHVDLPLLVSVEATGVCIPICNIEVLLAAVYKYSGRSATKVGKFEVTTQVLWPIEKSLMKRDGPRHQLLFMAL